MVLHITFEFEFDLECAIFVNFQIFKSKYISISC